MRQKAGQWVDRWQNGHGFTFRRALSAERLSKVPADALLDGLRPVVQTLPETGRSMCLPPTGQDKDSPPRGNRFLRMGICIPRPIDGNTTNQSPHTPAMCMPRCHSTCISTRGKRAPIPGAGEPTKNPPLRAGNRAHTLQLLQRPASAGSVTMPDRGQARHT